MEWLLLILALAILVILGISFFFKPPNVEKFIVNNDIDGLVRVLMSKSPDDDKLQAITALEQIGGVKIIMPLAMVIKDVRNSSAVVRRAAVDVIGHIDHEQVIASLSEALYDKNAKIRRTAVKALAERGEQAAKPLCMALKDPEPTVRRIAANGLIKLGDKALPLFRAMLNQADGDLHTLIYESLGQIGSQASIDVFQLGLENEDSQVRMSAAAGLGKIGDSKGVPMLVPLLEDRVADVRQVSATSLGQIGDDEAIEPLSQALEKEGHTHVAVALIRALSRLGAAAIDALADVLYHRPVEVRVAAVESLGNFQDERAVDLLAPVLFDDELELKKAAVNSLGDIGNESVVKIFRNALFRKDGDIRVDIYQALGKMPGQDAVELAIAGLTDHEDEVRQMAATVLESLGWQPATTELGCVYWIARKEWEKCIAMGLPAVVPLADALSNKDEEIQENAAISLVRIGSPAVDELIKVLEKDDLHKKEKAAEILGRIGDERAAGSLITALQHHDPGVRRAVLIALGRIGVPECLPPIRSAMSDTDTDVREAAGEAMVYIGAPAVRTLIEIITQEARFIRQTAVKALVNIGQPAVEPLVEALHEEDRDVKHTAAETLEKLGWDPDISETSVIYHIALGHWDACIAAGEIALNPLMETMLDRSTPHEDRKNAAVTLGDIGNPQAREALCKALKDRKREVRKAAAESLDKLGLDMGHRDEKVFYWIAKEQWKTLANAGVEAVRPLVEFIKDPSLGEHIIDTLERIGPDAVEYLVESLLDEDWEKRKSVAIALGRIGDARALNALISALEDGDQIVCLAAPKAFANVKNARPVAPLLPYLTHASYAVRLAAAETLVNLHQQGSIDAQSKSLILSRWKLINQKHTDVHYSATGTHEDEGIGIDF